MIDLTIAWFRSEMKGDPHLDRVKQFLDEELRHDLKSLVIELFRFPQEDEDFSRTGTEIGMRETSKSGKNATN